MKKVLSVFLAVVLMAVAVLPSFAKSDKCNCGEAPLIYVAALGSGTLTLDAGTENERTLFRPEIGEFLPDLLPIVPAAVQLIADKNYDAFGDVLIGCVNSVFGELALDENGNSSDRVTCEEFHPESADHGLDYSYYFGYDFRLDPVENAKLLHQFIQEVKEITKHDTVRFRASSMGGVTTMAYIRLYGTADIETIIFQCCPLQGTAVAGELYNGLVEIDKNALKNYASQALPELGSDFLSGILLALIETLDMAGVWDSLLVIADDLILNLKDRVFNECLIPIFGTLPGIWSFVPDEYYESGKEFMQLDPVKNAKLIEKLDFYHYEVQSKCAELVAQAKASGTTMYNVLGYDMQRTPLVTAHRETSDGTVDSKYASMGATCALIGETLPEDYVQAKYPEKNFMSPDRMIDASTCVMPENTWFIKDMLHSTTHDGHDALYRIMFESEKQLTVFDLEEYPQFLQNDVLNQSFYPVEAEADDSIQSAIDDLLNQFTFTKLVELIFKVIYSFLGA